MGIQHVPPPIQMIFQFEYPDILSNWQADYCLTTVLLTISVF